MELLSKAILPLSMISLGVQLSQAKIGWKNHDVWIVSSLKLFVLPLIGIALIYTVNTFVPGFFTPVGAKDLKVIKYRIADVIGFVNNNDRRFFLLQRQSGNLRLNAPEIIRLAEAGLSTQFCGEIPAKIIQGKSGQAQVDNLVQGRVQLACPVPEHRGFSSASPSCQQSEPFCLGKIIKAVRCLLVFIGCHQYFLGILQDSWFF